MEFQLPSPPLLLSFLFLLLLVAKRSLGSKAKYAGLPPGPWKLPFIGNIHHLVGKLPHHALRDLARAYGPVMLLRLGEVDVAVFSSREAAQEVLKTQDANFSSRPEISVAKIIAYDCTDIAFSGGDYWRQLRKICVMELLGAKSVKNLGSARSEEINRVLKGIAAVPAGVAVNLSTNLMTLTNAIVTRASFGERCSRQKQFLATVKEVVELASGFSVGDLFPSLKIIDNFTGLSSRLRRVYKIVDEILDATIQEHLKNRKQGDEEDLIDVLLRLKGDGSLEVPISYDNIKAVIVDMFFAGTETSSSITEWAMSELIRCPSAMAKLQKEVREAAKGKATVEDGDVAELTYLRAVVKETMRLHPPAPLLVPRYCKETCKVLGYTVPAGARVIINAWKMGRDPQYWSDAESFKPERFSDGDAAGMDFKGTNFEFVPFGGGRRICPGMSFGLASVELALARLLFHFDWQMPGGLKPQDLDMSEAFGLSSARKKPLKLVAVPRHPLPTSGGTRIFGPSQKYSSRDLASHTTLKPRKEGQDTLEELQKRNLREELEERERRHFSSKDKSYSEDRDRRKGVHLLEGTKREAEDRIIPRSIDADDSDGEVKDDKESDVDDDDNEDDTEALLSELERIKKERAEEKLRKEGQQQEEELKAKEAELIRGNPLININNSTSFGVKRRWDDDVVFKNQARGEAKVPKRFINDTIRNDFHRKFLQKYMK